MKCSRFRGEFSRNGTHAIQKASETLRYRGQPCSFPSPLSVVMHMCRENTLSAMILSFPVLQARRCVSPCNWWRVLCNLSCAGCRVCLWRFYLGWLSFVALSSLRFMSHDRRIPLGCIARMSLPLDGVLSPSPSPWFVSSFPFRPLLRFLAIDGGLPCLAHSEEHT